MCKNVKIMYKTCKSKTVVKIFWRRIGTSPLVKTFRKVYLIVEVILKSIAKHTFLSSAFNFRIDF